MSEKRTVVIGCRDFVRAGAVTQAVAARSGLTVTRTWPLERAIAAGTAADTAIVVLDGYPPAVALRDLADVTSARPDLGVLILGPFEPSVDVLIAFASGALGYLPSECTPVAVAAAVDAMLAGDAVLPRIVSLPLVQHLRLGGRGIVVSGLDGRSAVLTIREWEVLVQLRQARTTAEIAQHLVVSSGTVRTHVAALMHKLAAHDRRELSSSLMAAGNDDGHPH